MGPGSWWPPNLHFLKARAIKKIKRFSGLRVGPGSWWPPSLRFLKAGAIKKEHFSGLRPGPGSWWPPNLRFFFLRQGQLKKERFSGLRVGPGNWEPPKLKFLLMLWWPVLACWLVSVVGWVVFGCVWGDMGERSITGSTCCAIYMGGMGVRLLFLSFCFA